PHRQPPSVPTRRSSDLLASFWQTILSGADAVTEVPPERWDPELYFAPDGDGRRTPSKWGGFLAPVPFDPLRYGIPPAALRSIDRSEEHTSELQSRFDLV